MTINERRVGTAAELLAAVADPDTGCIAVAADLDGLPTFRLSPGQALAGGSGTRLRFESGLDGVELSADNRIEGLGVETDPDRRALFNDTTVESFGRLELRNLAISGVVRLLAQDKVRSGHVQVENVDVKSADAREYGDRPKGYGVEVVSGAFTLWNQHEDPAVRITADLVGLSTGRDGTPVRGGGIFVSGGGDKGGQLVALRLETGAI